MNKENNTRILVLYESVSYPYPYPAAPANVFLETGNAPRPNAARLNWSSPDPIEHG